MMKIRLPNKSTQPNSTSRLYRTIGQDTNSVSKELEPWPLLPLKKKKSNFKQFSLDSLNLYLFTRYH